MTPLDLEELKRGSDQVTEMRRMADTMDRENPGRNNYREVSPHTWTIREWAKTHEALINQIEGMRAALEKIAKMDGRHPDDRGDEQALIARQALRARNPNAPPTE